MSNKKSFIRLKSYDSDGGDVLIDSSTIYFIMDYNYYRRVYLTVNDHYVKVQETLDELSRVMSEANVL